MAVNFTEAKRAKQEAYEAACRTPGTPEHAARQARLDQRTRELQAEQDRARRAARERVAADQLATMRQGINLVKASIIGSTYTAR